MNKEILKKAVKAKLEKVGYNPKDVEKMMKKHFEEAVNTYGTVKKVSEYISYLWGQ